MNKITTTVNNTSYVFSTDNVLNIYIDIYPSIKLPNGNILHSIPVNCLDPSSDFILARGDKIELTTSNNNLPLLRVIAPSDNNRFNAENLYLEIYVQENCVVLIVAVVDRFITHYLCSLQL